MHIMLLILLYFLDVYLPNRTMKSLLIDHFGEGLAFMYPKDKRKSQLFYLSTTKTEDVIETLRVIDPVEVCAKQLKSECKGFDFELDSSFRYARDLELGLDKLHSTNSLQCWNRFFDTLFPSRNSSESIRRKCDVTFQNIYNMINNGQKKTPLHTAVAQSIHDNSKSKLLIDILNRLGLCISYDDLQRVDICITQEIINLAGPNRVPVSESIDSSSIIHGAMDNFDHEENTLSGIGGSHDTILVLFQKNEGTSNTTENISQKPEEIASMSNNTRSLEATLECQNLIRRGRFSTRGTIPVDFQPEKPPKFDDIVQMSKTRYDTWRAMRYFSNKEENVGVPSFSAVNSFLQSGGVTTTKVAFTPILPYVATEYDTIYTVMCNFQDVLLQKSQAYGPLWCDEGVYRLAKELQLLEPARFDNIFLGLGGFHLEKVIIACCGKYLEDTGIERVLVANEVYGPENVNSVMNGGNYARGIRGMAMISESLHTLLMDQYAAKSAAFDDEFKEISDRLKEATNVIKSRKEPETIDQEMLAATLKMPGLKEFKVNGEAESEQFLFWSIFIERIYPVLRDLTRSHREGDWQLHLSAVDRALPLVFAFDRTNYKRWLPLYYQDCLKLEQKYPLIHQNFLQGEFVAKLTKRKASAIPMDQALETKYNKPSKSASGIIGYTRRKEAVCKWDLIKHEKSNYTNMLRGTTGIDNQDEYSLHHEFSDKRTEADQKSVKQIVTYIAERGNPFDDTEPSIKNIATGATFDKETASFSLNCLDKGKAAYEKFRDERLEKKSSQLFDTIPKTRTSPVKGKMWKPPDVKKETINFLRIIDYSRLRNFDLTLLLKHEIVTTSYNLTKDGDLRKSPKSELSRELKKLLDEPCPTDVPESNLKTALVIDFMAYARKIPPKKMKLLTFEDFFKVLWQIFSTLSKGYSRMDIVFDVYLRQSIKEGERSRRSKSDPIETNIATTKQQIPVEMDRFWGSSENKMKFQQAFAKWLSSEYQSGVDFPVFLGGAHAENVTSCIKICPNGELEEIDSLRNDHEEADDRLLYHVNQIVRDAHYDKVIIASGDTDVFVCSMYHFNRWVYRGLKEMWIISGKRGSITAFPIHKLTEKLDPSVVDILPAVHALTGFLFTSRSPLISIIVLFHTHYKFEVEMMLEVEIECCTKDN